MSSLERDAADRMRAADPNQLTPPPPEIPLTPQPPPAPQVNIAPATTTEPTRTTSTLAPDMEVKMEPKAQIPQGCYSVIVWDYLHVLFPNYHSLKLQHIDLATFSWFCGYLLCDRCS